MECPYLALKGCGGCFVRTSFLYLALKGCGGCFVGTSFFEAEQNRASVT